MDSEWMRSIQWALSACPRLYRYSRAVVRYMGRVPLPKHGAEDAKKMQDFLLATAAVLKELKRCGARPGAIDGRWRTRSCWCSSSLRRCSSSSD
jgi:hypothetical protein